VPWLLINGHPEVSVLAILSTGDECTGHFVLSSSECTAVCLQPEWTNWLLVSARVEYTGCLSSARAKFAGYLSQQGLSVLAVCLQPGLLSLLATCLSQG
jgi:hypothetical protein